MSQYRYENYYFKALHDEPGLMSGCNLPDPDEPEGYHFVACDFHPRLFEALQQMYSTSTFTRCNYPR